MAKKKVEKTKDLVVGQEYEIDDLMDLLTAPGVVVIGLDEDEMERIEAAKKKRSS